MIKEKHLIPLTDSKRLGGCHSRDLASGPFGIRFLCLCTDACLCGLDCDSVLASFRSDCCLELDVGSASICYGVTVVVVCVDSCCDTV